ncbi:MAG TPA: LacI family DNA-binding transcriptional regulator [Terrimesophilobacter sp.]|nr:LacI family DNA-binding transcriptional regulator [Terrimesophilobacter sp.]
MATIYDVAALAGVSPATVSRVFNGMRVSEEKTLAVRTAAESLNFTPNRTARTLRKQNSEVIALLIPDIENPFFTSLARGVEDRAQQAGFSVVLCNTDDNTSKEAKYLEIAISENMAGVIVAPASDHSDLKSVLSRGRPIVAVDRGTGYDIAGGMVDNRPAGQAAAGALFDAGYHRVACITGPQGIETADERTRGWRQTVAQRGDYAPDDYLKHANHRVDGGRAAMIELLSMANPPDAVVATNNLMGVGALQILSEAGLAPPAIGVSVIGDLPFTTLDPAMITLVHLPARNLGITAATMLIERINGDSQPPRTVVLRNEISRASIPAQHA